MTRRAILPGEISREMRASDRGSRPSRHRRDRRQGCAFIHDDDDDDSVAPGDNKGRRWSR